MTSPTDRFEAIAHIMRLADPRPTRLDALEEESRVQGLLIQIALAWLELGDVEQAERALKEARI